MPRPHPERNSFTLPVFTRLHPDGVASHTLGMVSSRVVMFVSRDAGYRELYTNALRSFGLLSVWATGVDEGRSLLGQYSVAALIFDPSSREEWEQCGQLVAAAGPSPVLVMASGHEHQAQEAFDAGCVAFVAGPCPPASLAAVLQRAMSGDRRIIWPETPLEESLAG